MKVQFGFGIEEVVSRLGNADGGESITFLLVRHELSRNTCNDNVERDGGCSSESGLAAILRRRHLSRVI